ncbi:MAG: glycosyltransferase family 4 protein [Pseudomonadota bacterium]
MHARAGSRVLIFANTAWNLKNFRAGLIRALVADGYDVVAAAPADAALDEVARMGARTVPIPVDSKGKSATTDFRLFLRTIGVLRRERPAVLLTYTVKPNIYGALAARLCAVPAIATVTGLGTPFLAGGALAKTVRVLYRAALSHPNTVFFQNSDDRTLFLGERLVREDRAALVPGSGVDLSRFVPRGASTQQRRVLFVGRLLADKGVHELVEAARILRAGGHRVEFQLLGPLGCANPSAISSESLAEWQNDGLVTHLGSAEDVRPAIAEANLVVLPSYREGTPRSLLEAAAMGKPLIATDVPGCREPVVDGQNGFLCKARSANSLAEAVARFFALSPANQAAMGQRSRAIAEDRFDERIVIEATRDAIANALAHQATRALETAQLTASARAR